MQKNLKTVSVAIPNKQFRQILDYLYKKDDENKGNGDGFGTEPTVASFLREAITNHLTHFGYDEVKATFSARQGRPARRR